MKSLLVTCIILTAFTFSAMASSAQWTYEQNGYSTFKLSRGAETFGFCNQVDLPRTVQRDFNSATQYSSNDKGFVITCGRSNDYIQFQLCTSDDCKLTYTRVTKLSEKPYSYNMVKREYTAIITGVSAQSLKSYMKRLKDLYFETGADNVSQISINCGLPDTCEIEFIFITESK